MSLQTNPFEELKRRIHNNVEMYQQKVNEAWQALEIAKAVLQESRNMEHNIESWVKDFQSPKS
jgi:hypothetical protein